MSTFKVDPAALRATEPKYNDVSDRVITAVQSLKQIVEAEGECWGADEIGEKFAKGYVDPAGKAVTTGGNLGAILSSMAGNMASAAETLQQQDQSNAGSIAQTEF
ncbi:WXG100 family type VII secretion target [Nocardia spumae]|uniref:WXG100 family type VII secretion target n=1 Tax=Nocardia spumae TaxID=2887190 RepID=UPI003FD73A8B